MLLQLIKFFVYDIALFLEKLFHGQLSFAIHALNLQNLLEHNLFPLYFFSFYCLTILDFSLLRFLLVEPTQSILPRNPTTTRQLGLRLKRKAKQE